MKNAIKHSAARFPGMLVLLALASLAPADLPPMEPRVHLGEKTFGVTIADTGESRRKGLSGRAPLARECGLLFVFNYDGYHAIWMKNMRFSIDVIWIDNTGIVVHIERGLVPDSYPQTFVPASPARYVLEVAAGEGKGVSPGMPVRFENIPGH